MMLGGAGGGVVLVEEAEVGFGVVLAAAAAGEVAGWVVLAAGVELVVVVTCYTSPQTVSIPFSHRHLFVHRTGESKIRYTHPQDTSAIPILGRDVVARGLDPRVHGYEVRDGDFELVGEAVAGLAGAGCYPEVALSAGSVRGASAGEEEACLEDDEDRGCGAHGDDGFKSLNDSAKRGERSYLVQKEGNSNRYR